MKKFLIICLVVLLCAGVAGVAVHLTRGSSIGPKASETAEAVPVTATLTKVEEGDLLAGVSFNKSLSTAQVTRILATLEYSSVEIEGEIHQCAELIKSDDSALVYVLKTELLDGMGYVLFGDNYDYNDQGEVGEGFGCFLSGRMQLGENGAIVGPGWIGDGVTFSHGALEVTDCLQEAKWNGILFAPVIGEDPVEDPEAFPITATVINGSMTGAYQISEGETATVILAADSGFALPASITVSGASHTYDQSTGAVVISAPTSNVTINCSCEAVQYLITTSVTNGSYSGDTYVTVAQGGSVTITPASGYVLPASVIVTGADDNYTYDSTTGVVSIGVQVGAVSIACVCEQDQPAPSLMAFQVGDSLIGGTTKIKFNTALSTSAITSIIDSLQQMGGGKYMVSASDGQGHYFDIYAAIEGQYYMISANGTIVWINEAVGSYAQGWQNLDANDEFFVSGSATTTIPSTNGLNPASGWNGVLLGIDNSGSGGSLTLFSVGQEIAGFDFGNVSNGDTSAAMDAFLASLPLPQSGEAISILACSSNTMLLAASMNGVYVLMVADDGFTQIYASDDMAGSYITAGFANLVDGKYIFGLGPDDVRIIGDYSGWNGTLIGAVEEEPDPDPDDDIDE